MYYYKCIKDGKVSGITKSNVPLNIAGFTQIDKEEFILLGGAAENLNAIKDDRIAYSKTALAEYLTSHPLTWTDGKQYSVTEDKQALLTGNLAAYQLDVTLGQTAELTWNATGEECTVWTFENLAALAIAIKAYVKPLVAYQQAAEVAINACTDADAVAAVPIDYESVTQDA